jgi:hypothetical protein
MKRTEPRPRLGDLLDHRRRPIFDLWPAIERLNQELQQVEILEEAIQEEGWIFPMVTKAYMPAMQAERRLDGSLPPVRVVRFPERVDDAEEWSKRCRAWQRPPSTIEWPDTRDTDPSSS